MRIDPDRCYALVPIKRRALCKSRLASVLDGRQRLVLVRSMLQRVLDALSGAGGIEQVAVVSAERDTVPADITLLPDAGDGLNAALQHAQQGLLERGARAILVLPADLPHLRAEDVDALVRAGRSGGFALAPDAAGTGTNALFWSAESVQRAAAGAAPLRFEFGPDSCRRHQAQAVRLGLAVQLVHRPGLAFDVDTAADLAQLDALQELAYGNSGRVQHA
ncbi:MAG TPA: 2-phospho-L-lactate guanylyltransferase [Steroidobacteraceae bacterium]|jgi:2-phospho-L-lactate guanylyltransferase|nr:2-phospho-L-lactate guanylyltransferase [Steroidobacteraceae bacterium]